MTWTNGAFRRSEMHKQALCLVCVASCLVSAAATAGLTFSCDDQSDLYRLVKATGHEVSRFDKPTAAIQAAPDGSGVLILSQDYPNALTPIGTADYQLAESKRLRLYVEFPASVPNISLGDKPQLVATGPYGSVLERLVVADDYFGESLPAKRIMAFYDCSFLPVASDLSAIDTHIVAARVVGHDTAVLGLPEKTWPILFSVREKELLVSTTTFSPCVTARFMPVAAWRVVLNRTLSWLDPSAPSTDWRPTVHPTHDKEASFPKGSRKEAIRRASQWYIDSKLLLDEAGMKFIYETPNPYGVEPFPKDWRGKGDGSLGIVECYIGKRIYLDGSQPANPCIRADCSSESAMGLAFCGTQLNLPERIRIAKNLIDFVFLKSEMSQGPRSDPGSPVYGMLSHNTKSIGQNYSDDHARSLLGAIATAAITKDNRWDESICRTILADFRLTNADGYSQAMIPDDAIFSSGWESYWYREGHLYSPHYQAYIWATFLWLYDKTGYTPLLERARNGIDAMMKAYPDQWIAECGRIDEELCHMLLPLCYLVCVDENPTHRAWLQRLVDDILKTMDSCGAIPQRVTVPYTSNDQYGTGEAPVIYQTGDAGVDLLYTMNFAFSGLHEASFILRDPKLDQALDRIEAFLIRIQTASEAHPELSGTWYRGFDFNHWEYWGSDGEIGWCLLSTETGWTHSWITSTLVLREKRQSLWDATKESNVREAFEPLRKKMIPDKLFKAKTLEEYRAGK